MKYCNSRYIKDTPKAEQKNCQHKENWNCNLELGNHELFIISSCFVIEITKAIYSTLLYNAFPFAINILTDFSWYKHSMCFVDLFFAYSTRSYIYTVLFSSLISGLTYTNAAFLHFPTSFHVWAFSSPVSPAGLTLFLFYYILFLNSPDPNVFFLVTWLL